MAHKSFITSCVESSAELIDNMVDAARDITHDTFKKHIGAENFNQFSNSMGYEDCPGLSLSSDYSVSFYKSKYDGEPCVYCCHSAIEYVFI